MNEQYIQNHIEDPYSLEDDEEEACIELDELERQKAQYEYELDYYQNVEWEE